MKDFDSVEYKRSRNAYMAQSMFEYFISLLVTDAFLAKLLSSVGISDSLIGVISSFITLAFIIQFASILLVRLRVSTKKLVITFDTLSIFFFMFLYIIPFLPLSKTGKTILVMLCILLAYLGKYLILNICFKWANSYVDPTKRASYSATKEMISLFSGMVFTAVIGWIIDRFEEANNLSGAFLFIASAILILNICNFISLISIKKEAGAAHAGDSEPFSKIFANTFGNKNFRSIIVLTVLWDIARYFTIGFMGIYKTKELMLSVFAVQLINISADFVRMLISRPFGRYSDKYSYAKGFKLGILIISGAFFINMFTTRTTWFFVIVYTILYSCSVAGTNQNSYNITYSYVDSKYITQAMSIKNCIGGLCGFLASIAGGKILDLVQKNGNSIFGVQIYGQQLLSAISLTLCIICIIYISKVIEKQEIKLQ